jgi:hypothetical protein
VAIVLLLVWISKLVTWYGQVNFMKYIFLFGRSVALAVGFAAAVTAVSAATLTYTYAGETQGGLVMTINTASYSGIVQVGEYNLTTSDAGFPSTLKSYCTDVGSDLTSPYTYTPTALSLATGVNPAWISGGIQNAAKLWANDKGGATTAVQTAGLQLAIWEALYNNLSGGFTASTFGNSGNNGFRITSAEANTVSAENYAATLLNNFGSLPAVQDVVWLAPTPVNNGSTPVQGLLMQTAGVGVPEVSSTLGLLGFATAILGLLGKRFRRAA